MRHFSVGLWLVAGLVGAAVFWIFQVLTGPSTIIQSMGQRIVSQGGYSQSMLPPIGWGVHIGVSLVYSLAFAVLMVIPFMLAEYARLVLGLVVAGTLGWGATLISTPAEAAAVSVLSGHGYPAVLPPLNRTFGPALSSHLLFFAAVWLVYQYIPYVSRRH